MAIITYDNEEFWRKRTNKELEKHSAEPNIVGMSKKNKDYGGCNTEYIPYDRI